MGQCVQRFLVEIAANLYRLGFSRGDAAHVIVRVNVAAIMMIGGAEGHPRQRQKDQRQTRPSLPGGDKPAEHRPKHQQQTHDEWHGGVMVEYNAGGVGQRRRHERRPPDAVEVGRRLS